ncbi:hypothetical protein [Terriglobus sp.]|uniref:hypothetical protein n=1 Tax=Terriglobus sp. TaxID=1889013 RepID=UPI003B003797
MPRDFATSSTQFLASIDAEIERLQNLRQQVAAAVDADEALAKPEKAVRKGMSAEGRQKIAEAQKARWAKQNKAAKSAAKAPAKKVAAKKTASKKAPAKKTAAVKTTEQA